MTHVVGIDIACESFVARILACSNTETAVGEATQFDNSTEGFTNCSHWFTTRDLRPEQTLVVMEATGVYWEALAIFFTQQGHPISVVNPAQIKYFSRSVLQRGKTDALDAHIIALFGARMKPRLWNPPSPLSQDLQVLMRQRDAYVVMLTEERCRLHSYEHAAHTPHQAIAICKGTISFLRKQIKELDESFKNTLHGDPHWSKLYDLLRSIPSIGTITASVFLSETRGLNEFLSSRQLVAYTGIAPAPFSSGTSVYKKPRISKIGNARLRKAFYMAAVSSIRYNPSMKIVFERLLEKGKPKKLILTAIARKLLVLCFAVCKSEKPYQLNYSQRQLI